LDAGNLHPHDAAVAYIHAMQILSHWRQDIVIGVSEGESYETYSNTILPSPKTEPKILAMRLVHFKKVDSNHLSPATIEKMKEEKAAEITHQIVYSTRINEPIAVTYLLSDSKSDNVATESDNAAAKSNNVAAKSNNVVAKSDNVAAESDNVAAESDNVAAEPNNVAAASNNVAPAAESDNAAAAAGSDNVAAAAESHNVATAAESGTVAGKSVTISKLSGTAVKSESNKWHVFLTNKIMIAMDEDLMDANKYYVQQKWISLNDNRDEIKKRKQCAK